jgi:glutathione synthase/RimK-type ligase-like ATP-grasp enzyme
VAILSQVADQTEVDWRKGGRIDLHHEAIDLPQNIIDSCIELMSKLNLRFGAIDLVCDLNGDYWFLEINPNGQWAWIENQTKLPIASAIVDELVSHGKKNEL